MSGNYDNMRIFSDEDTDIYLAPKGTIEPTTLDAPAAPWVAVGFLGEDGITNGLGVEMVDIYAFQGGVKARSKPKKTDRTFKFVAIEHKLQTVELYNGPVSAVTTTGVTRYKKKASVPAVEMAVFARLVDGPIIETAYFVINVTERGDVVDNGDNGRQYEITASVIGDISVQTNDPAFVVTP